MAETGRGEAGRAGGRRIQRGHVRPAEADPTLKMEWRDRVTYKD